MLWEVWLETAESFEALKKSLHNRGYRELPVYARYIIRESYRSETKVSKDQEVKKSMLRKKRR